MHDSSCRLFQAVVIRPLLVPRIALG